MTFIACFLEPFVNIIFFPLSLPNSSLSLVSFSKKSILGKSFNEDEIQNLRTQIQKRIKFWKLDKNEKNKVRLRIEVKGYCENRKKIIETAKSEFQEYIFHDDHVPYHEKLNSIQSNSQLNKIAQRVISKIENEEDWNFDDGEPTKNDIVWKALETIYGSISR